MKSIYWIAISRARPGQYHLIRSRHDTLLSPNPIETTGEGVLSDVLLGPNMRDTDVEVRGDSLKGRNVLLGVTGGIAAVDTVRLARELRRHGAELTVIRPHLRKK